MFISNWITFISFDPPRVEKLNFSWKSTRAGGFDLNFDVSSNGNPGLAGFVCVIRDHNGRILHVICGPLGVCNSIKAKILGLLMGLHNIKKFGILDCH